ncbi:MAG: hypothetical protein JNK04_02665 [Myxococcales bacterium]|nr:hypothetical protein [Myxococcales bacterium]
MPLLTNAHYVVDELPERAVRVTRLGRLFSSEAEVNEACEPVQAVLDQLGRGSYVLLLDSRFARGSNDPDYERWFTAQRARMPRGFKRAALLMKTAIGALHSDRLRRADGANDELQIFQDLPAACAYLGIGIPPELPEELTGT